MVYWKNFDFDRYPQTSADYRRNHKYSSLIGAFDLETTNYHDIFAFMYVWQFGIGDQVAYGRTWADLREFLADIKEHLHINMNHRLIVMDHNLKYDFAFFCREVPIDGEIIAKSRHEILMCTVFDCLEFRDSLSYTEKSLDEMGKELNFPKISGFDYAKIRHSETELSAAEMDYCGRDVEILLKYYEIESKKYGSIGRVPLTATRRVKMLISQRMAENDSESRLMMYKIRKRQLDPSKEYDKEVLKMLRIAFFGGFNYCTTMYKNQIVPDCDDYDANSHYIAQILLHKFPKDTFKPMEIPKNRNELENLKHKKGIYKNKALLITFCAENIRAKNPDIAFLPYYPKNYYYMDLVDRRSMVTKKLHELGRCEMTLTDVDFYLLWQFYEMDRIKIKSILGTDYGVLPDYIVDTCVDLYRKKQSAKAELKRIEKDREPTAAEQARYDLTKSFLNRVYGIFVQDPVRTNYIFDGVTIRIDKENRIRTSKTQYAPVLYQWGCWVAAWARYELLTLFRAVSTTQNGKYMYNVLYCDTDSLKGFDIDDTIISQYNAKVKERVRKFCARKRLDFSLLDGLGEFERKHYDYFKTIGQKQYCYVTPNGEFNYHVSGLARPWWDDEKQKFVCYFDDFDTLAEKMDALSPDMVIPAEKSGLMESIHGSEREPEIVEDYTGKKIKIHVKSYILLQQKGFKGGEDLEDLLEGMDADRLEFMYNTIGTFAGGKKY